MAEQNDATQTVDEPQCPAKDPSTKAEITSGSDLLYEAGRVSCDTQPHLARKGRIMGRIKIVVQAKQFFFCWEPYPEHGNENAAQYALNHPLHELHSLQRRNSHLIVILNQGMTLPPFHFQDGATGVKNFIAFCRANLDFEPSPQDANLFLRKPSPTLIRSLEGLGISVQETVREAKWTFFEKLSLVTKFTREQLFEGPSKRYPGKPPVEGQLESTPSFEAAVKEAANNSAVASVERDVQCQQRTELGDLGEFDVLNVKVPQVTKECHRRSPITRADWEQFIDGDGRIADEASLREAIFYGGCDPDCRKEVWLYLLNHRPACKAEAEKFRKLKEEEYFVMKNQWITMTSTQLKRNQPWSDVLHRIQKDVFRTDRECEFFAGDNNPNLDKLHDILATYCTYNYDLGYVQGMNDLLSVIMMVVEGDEVDSFWCFANVMETMGSNFSMDQMGMTGHLTDLRCLLRFMDPELMDYLEKHDSGNLFFCFRWLLINFKREFPLNDLMVLWEAIWSQWLSPQYHLFIALAILYMHRFNLMKPGLEFDDILQYINNLSMNMNVEAVLNVAEQLNHRLAQYKPNTVPDELRRIVKPWKTLHPINRMGPRSTDGLLTTSSPAHSWLDVGEGSEADSEPLSEPVIISADGLTR